MSHQITNLTLPIVNEEIDHVLDTFPYYPYQQAFAIPNLRQRLTTYALTRVQNLYASIDPGRDSMINLCALSGSMTQRDRIRNILHGGIQRILQDSFGWGERWTYRTTQADWMASNWFG